MTIFLFYSPSSTEILAIIPCGTVAIISWNEHSISMSYICPSNIEHLLSLMLAGS